MNEYLAIDIGASSGRHIVSFVKDGKIETREVYRFPNGARMKQGQLCWDADGLMRHVVAGLKAAHEQGFAPVSIGIDTWGVDFALLDGAGDMVGDLVAYRDSRTNGMDAELEKTLPFERHYALSGTAKQPFNTVYQMMAALRGRPQYRETVRDFLLVPEYLAYRLTGKRAHEWTNASTTALCDAAARTWSREILCSAGLPEQWFQTPLLPPGSALGPLLPEIERQAGFGSTVLLTATHDTGSAYLAIPARDEHAAYLSSGTWSLLGTELQAPVTTDAARLSGFTNEGGYGGTTRFLKNIMGLWIMQCIRRELQEKYSFSEMAEMAATSGYPTYVDVEDNRFLAPQNMLDEVGAALREQGAPPPHGLPELLRAVTLGLAVSYRESIRQMSAVTGKSFTSLNIVGGGSQNVVLNQMTADVTGLTVYAGPAEGTALGNLAVQMIAAGEFASLAGFRAALAHSTEIVEYTPNLTKG